MYTFFFLLVSPETFVHRTSRSAGCPLLEVKALRYFWPFKKTKQPATPALINSLPLLSHSSRQWVTCLGSVALNVFLSATLPFATAAADAAARSQVCYTVSNLGRWRCGTPPNRRVNMF